VGLLDGIRPLDQLLLLATPVEEFPAEIQPHHGHIIGNEPGTDGGKIVRHEAKVRNIFRLFNLLFVFRLLDLQPCLPHLGTLLDGSSFRGIQVRLEEGEVSHGRDPEPGLDVSSQEIVELFFPGRQGIAQAERLVFRPSQAAFDAQAVRLEDLSLGEVVVRQPIQLPVELDGVFRSPEGALGLEDPVVRLLDLVGRGLSPGPEFLPGHIAQDHGLADSQGDLVELGDGLGGGEADDAEKVRADVHAGALPGDGTQVGNGAQEAPLEGVGLGRQGIHLEQVEAENRQEVRPGFRHLVFGLIGFQSGAPDQAVLFHGHGEGLVEGQGLFPGQGTLPAPTDGGNREHQAEDRCTKHGPAFRIRRFHAGYPAARVPGGSTRGRVLGCPGNRPRSLTRDTGCSSHISPGPTRETSKGSPGRRDPFNASKGAIEDPVRSPRGKPGPGRARPPLRHRGLSRRSRRRRDR